MFRLLVFISSLLFFVFVGLVALAPQEQTLGASQKVLYTHVPHAIATYLLLGCGIIGFVVSLSKRHNHLGNAIIEQSLKLSFVTATVSLLTGMIWAKYAWNTFFHAEPRLVSFLMLWFLLLSAYISRIEGPGASYFQKTVLILAVMAVPLVKYSIKLLPENLRLHPTVVSSGGLDHPMFEAALISGIIFFAVFWLIILWMHVKVDFLKRMYIYG